MHKTVFEPPPKKKVDVEKAVKKIQSINPQKKKNRKLIQ